MMTFELILTVDGSVLSAADSPAELDYSAAYPYKCWGVIVRYTSCDGLATFMKTLRRVNLPDSDDFRRDFDYAVAEVRRELSFSYGMGDFKYPEYLFDSLVVDIGEEQNNE